jgi:hypothetical protein
VLTNNAIAQPVYLKIAEAADGSLRAECERPGKPPIIPLPVTGLNYKKPQLHFAVWAMNGAFTGFVNESNSTFTGQWKQSRPFIPTKTWRLVWTRVNPDEKELALQAGENFEYTRDTELQGHWRGIFPFTSGVALNLVLNIARLPDGTCAATLDSPDQSLFAMPADVLEFVLTTSS